MIINIIKLVILILLTMVLNFTDYILKESFLDKEIYPQIDNIIGKTNDTIFRNITHTKNIDIKENCFVSIRDTFYVFECIFKKNNNYYHGLFYADGKHHLRKLKLF